MMEINMRQSILNNQVQGCKTFMITNSKLHSLLQNIATDIKILHRQLSW